MGFLGLSSVPLEGNTQLSRAFAVFFQLMLSQFQPCTNRPSGHTLLRGHQNLLCVSSCKPHSHPVQ